MVLAPTTQLVSCVKNEAVFLLEWLAHHRMLGFEEIIFFSNDCDDGTCELLDQATALGYCRHYQNPVAPGDAPQPSAYKLHRKLGLRQGIDFAMVLDADEFLNIHTGAGLLSDLIAAMDPEADLLCLNWKSFGTGFVEHWRPGNVTAQFL